MRDAGEKRNFKVEDRLQVVELLGDLIELFLGALELFVALLVLLLPHVPFRLDGGNLAFVVFSLDIGKAEPGEGRALVHVSSR